MENERDCDIGIIFVCGITCALRFGFIQVINLFDDARTKFFHKRFHINARQDKAEDL